MVIDQLMQMLFQLLQPVALLMDSLQWAAVPHLVIVGPVDFDYWFERTTSKNLKKMSLESQWPHISGRKVTVWIN